MHARASLAASDVLLAISLVVMFTFSVAPFDIPSAVDTLFSEVLVEFSMTVSFLHLSLMSYTRYVSLKHPIRFRRSSLSKSSRSFAYLGSIWLLAIVSHAMLVVGQEYFWFDRDTAWIIMGSLLYVTPYCITMCLTVAMLRAFLKTRKKQTTSFTKSESFVSYNQEKQQRKLVLTVAFIVLGYSLTCLPRVVGYIAKQLSGTDSDMCTFRFIVFIIMSLNTVVDVAVYSCFDKQYRKHVKNTFQKSAFWRKAS